MMAVMETVTLNFIYEATIYSLWKLGREISRISNIYCLIAGVFRNSHYHKSFDIYLMTLHKLLFHTHDNV